MNRKNIICTVAALLVFLVQLLRGLFPAVPEPGMIQTGAMEAPSGIVVAALLAGFLTWCLTKGIFALLDKRRKPN